MIHRRLRFFGLAHLGQDHGQRDPGTPGRGRRHHGPLVRRPGRREIARRLLERAHQEPALEEGSPIATLGDLDLADPQPPFGLGDRPGEDRELFLEQGRSEHRIGDLTREDAERIARLLADRDSPSNG